MNTKRLVLAVVLLASVAACRNRETALTGAYGNAVVTGQVMMTDGATSPAGVEVSVVGTGMVITLGEDGRFTFVDVPRNAELQLQRASDGIGARIQADAGKPMLIQLGQSGASSGRRRGITPGKSEYEGLIRSIGSESFVLYTSHKSEVTIEVDDLTIIRKGGNRTLTLEDLKVDDRVHVKAIQRDGDIVALEVVLQNDGEEDEEDDDANKTMTANGPVRSNDGSSLVVFSQPKGEVTVQVDGNTIIKRQGQRISISDIKVGDEVNAMGTRVDDTTLLARQIEVRGNNKEKDKGKKK